MPRCHQLVVLADLVDHDLHVCCLLNTLTVQPNFRVSYLRQFVHLDSEIIRIVLTSNLATFVSLFVSAYETFLSFLCFSRC